MDLRSDTRSSRVLLDQDSRPRLAFRIALAWLGFFGCVLIIGGIVQVATARLPVVISHAAVGLGVTASALGLVSLLRRHADRRPWSGVGLTLDRIAIPQLVFGLVLATILATVAGAAAVHLGLADWAWSAEATNKSAEQGLASAAILIALSVLLVQGFPEELVFRGYMFRNLGATLPLWATVTVSSLIFGSMHVFSSGGATTLGERMLYAVAMTGFGLMLAACRTVSGALWLGHRPTWRVRRVQQPVHRNPPGRLHCDVADHPRSLARRHGVHPRGPAVACPLGLAGGPRRRLTL
ncbi:MAG: lysostaphin resistance A-like protein [Pseudonocardiaceae bacterium]